jgi:hypothetical protein
MSASGRRATFKLIHYQKTRVLMTVRLSGYYNLTMSRFADQQSDLFASAPSAQAPAPPPIDPFVELQRMHALVRAAERLPWPDLPSAMEWEYRVLFLARQSGAEGQRLASTIMDETERLFAAQEREQLAPGYGQATSDVG